MPILTVVAEKYLPALKCLLALKALRPEHPKYHELSGRFKLALDTLSEPLPDQVKKVIDETFLSKLDSKKSLNESNEQYLTEHKDSAAHVHSVVRLRRALSPEDKDAVAKSVQNLRDTLDAEATGLQEAEEGLRVLDELRAGVDAKEAYVAAARGRWAEASVFQQR